MPKTKTYRVHDNRIRFICDSCGAKRSLSVRSDLRSKSVRCHKCGTLSRCALNHREQRREMQTGKAAMILSNGKELPIDLQDYSPRGVGVQTKPGLARSAYVREEVHFKCSWNPRLFAQGRYIIRNIKGDRIGVENVAYRGWN